MSYVNGIYLVARREYLAYVGAWGFWVSLVSTPLLLAMVIFLPVALRQAEPTRYIAVLANPPSAGTLHVPLSAVLVKGNQSGVFRLSTDGKLTLVPVTVVQFTETAAIVKGALTNGDRIVAAGVHKLKEGDVVKPLDDPRITGDGKVAVVPVDANNAASQLTMNSHGVGR